MRWPWSKPQPEQRAMTWWAADIEPSQMLNAAGVAVSSTSAMSLSAAWAAVALVSDSIATLPVDVFTEDGDRREPVPPELRPRWLSNPGNALSWIDVLGQGTTSLLLRGEAFILTPRDNGEVQGLVVLDPDKVQPDENSTSGWASNGEPIDAGDLLVMRGLMLPGSKRGLGPIAAAREAFGSALATQRFGAAFFGNGAWVGTTVEVPGTLSEDGQKALKAYVNQHHRGSSNAHKVGILIEGAKLSRPITFSPEDSQFLQTRDFQVADIARFFGVPPEEIGGTSGNSLTYSTLEGRSTHLVKHALLRWIVRWEAALTALWHSEGGPENGRIKLNVKGLLRGSTKERYDSYAVALDKGFMTVDEVRALEDLPPLNQEGAA